MASYKLSELAKADLREVAAFTLQEWGADQASRYLDGFEDTCRLLATQPNLGKSAAQVMPGLRRFPFGSHVLFYLAEPEGLFIVRLLHRSMDVGLHL